MRMSPSGRCRLATGAGVLAMTLGGCGGSDDPASLPAGEADGSAAAVTTTVPEEVPVSGSISAFDQTSDGRSVTVATAAITGATGYLVIHTDDGGPGMPIVGHAAIPVGKSSKVVVALDQPITTGVFWAMLHRDGGELGRFEWPGGPDGPVRPADGRIAYAEARITVTVL